MEEILKFLRELELNNNREWFMAHKDWYQKMQQRWYDFCLELIAEIGQYDPDIAKLTIKDCTYRIYRDTRFTNDKSPYKTHFGVFLCPGGKKSMHAGYYFHVGTGSGEGYPFFNMLAAGNYCYEPEAIKILHEDIAYGWEEFNTQVMKKVNPAFSIDMDGALKKVPKEFPADAPYADFMRLKCFCLNAFVDDDFITAPNLAHRVSELFRSTKPFCNYVNRAVDYAREEK